MSDDEIIAVVQAHKKGKKIEMREHGRVYWGSFERLQWNFRDFDYRVAPEPRKPREWYVEPASGLVYDCPLAGRPNYRILVREVIE